jgi:hypothetical protein
MDSSPMHGGAQGETLPTCDWCGDSFKPKRAWARFCGPGCRNAFHASEARILEIHGAALRMYAALAKIAEGREQAAHPAGSR